MSRSEQIIPHGHVLRYNLRERATHWTAGAAYVYLLGTGLAFWSPWLYWLAVALGGTQISRMLHPWAGLIFFAAVWYMYVTWAPEMKHSAEDRKWWAAVTGVVLWFSEYIPWSLRFLRYFAVLIHPAAALVTIGLFMIHLYMGIFAERGAFGSVIRGDVSIEFAKRYHPMWYSEIAGESTSRRK